MVNAEMEEKDEKKMAGGSPCRNDAHRDAGGMHKRRGSGQEDTEESSEDGVVTLELFWQKSNTNVIQEIIDKFEEGKS